MMIDVKQGESPCNLFAVCSYSKQKKRDFVFVAQWRQDLQF